MYNHVLKDYVCPICLAVRGMENEQTLIRKRDVVYRDEVVLVYMSSFTIPGIPARKVLISPVEHFENVYDLPESVGHRIMDMGKRVALALKEVYECEGITFLQNNEPAGDQHAFHYHLHVFPRWEGDRLRERMTEKVLAPEEERFEFAEKLREKFVKL